MFLSIASCILAVFLSNAIDKTGRAKARPARQVQKGEARPGCYMPSSFLIASTTASLEVPVMVRSRPVFS